MTESSIILYGVLLYFFGIVLIIVTLYTIRIKTRKKLEKELIDLEVKKNSIINATVLTEFKKLESLINNDFLLNLYNSWKKDFDSINEKIPLVTDDLVNIESLLVENKFKEAAYSLAESEMNISVITSEVDVILEHIQEITLSEERNRETVTKLKTVYRGCLTKFNKNRNDYKGIDKPIELQFENINKLFGAFEEAIDKNEFENIGKIVRALDDLIKNIVIVIDEAPTTILLGKVVVPKKISDVTTSYNRLKKSGFNLDYLNLDYNIQETNKKLNDIFDRLNVLNLEDSIFILKTMLDYYDSLFKDFEKEKQCKKIYEKSISILNDKIIRLNVIMKNIYIELDKMKSSYTISDKEIAVIDEIRKELIQTKESYKEFSDRTRTKTNPFSQLSKEGETLSIKLNTIEDNVEKTLKSLSSLKEDELRAREELSNIKEIISEAKIKIKSYNLPIIPKYYYVQLEESLASLKEIVKELDQRPIRIDILNTRVETGRDLSFKVYNTSNELVKTCAMSEMAIVYANRYRTTNKDLEKGIIKSEKEFWNGNYRKSLELILNVLNTVEPGIHSKLLKAYETK